MITANNNTIFCPLSDSNLSDEEVIDIYRELRYDFEQRYPNKMVDASDAYILTVFPFKRGEKVPDNYNVVNYETGLFDGKPALRKVEGGQEILLFD